MHLQENTQLDLELWVKERKGAKTRNRYNHYQVPHLTQDTTWENPYLDHCWVLFIPLNIAHTHLNYTRASSILPYDPVWFAFCCIKVFFSIFLHFWSMWWFSILLQRRSCTIQEEDCQTLFRVSTIIDRCTLYTPGCRMKAHKSP